MKAFEKILLLGNAGALIMMIVSRTPTLIEDLSVLGTTLQINVGHVVVFSLPLLFLLVMCFWIWRDRSILVESHHANNKWILPLLVYFPVFAALFMFVQYIFEFAPPGECASFDRIRLFWDYRLYEIQPEYCFSLSPDVQKLMPYIYAPLQTWSYVVLVVATAWCSIKLWRHMREHEDGARPVAADSA